MSDPKLPKQQIPESQKIFDPLQLSEKFDSAPMPLGGPRRPHQKMAFAITDDEETLAKHDEHPLAGTPYAPPRLAKSAVTYTQDLRRGENVTRLAFEEDPTKANHYQSLWKPKNYLTPDNVCKTIGIRDSLVAAIVGGRSNQISAFGRELQDRFATGFRVEPRRGVMEDASGGQKEILQKRISDASKRLSTCGSTEGVEFDDRMSLATFLGLQTRNGLLMGRFATEIIFTREPDGGRTFHSFRPADAATIYAVAPKQDHADQVREQALYLLQQMQGPDADKLKPEKFENDEYAYVQVIEGTPRQAFTSEEMIVHTLYPVTDIELRGYPVTPIDTCIDAIATHMNITQHNKLYFQSGRAARGMIIIKSTDVDQALVAQIRQHFNASINSVSNSWRVPVFGVDPEDSVEWAPLDMQGARDQEFQYLQDQNAREILSAFQMSPEELPGYQHLSRGTNSQALSESSNEYKLTAARDIGIRPLLNQFQDFLNDVILPLIDPVVAQLCTLKLYGLEADTAEKESTRIQQDMGIHMTQDEIQERTEKDPVGKRYGGKMLLNPAWQQIIKENLMHGDIIEHFFGVEGASKDENLQYIQNPMWFQFQSLKLQTQQMEQEAQAQKQQAAAGAPPEGGPEGGSPGGQDEGQESELASGADQVLSMLKHEKQLSPEKRKLLHHHDAIVKRAMDDWEKESQEVLAEVVSAIKKA